MSRRAHLRALAGELGILPSYVDVSGRTRRTSDATRQALLAAMGIDASSEEAARRALARMAEEAAGRMLEPVRVVRQTDARTVRARVSGAGATWDLELREEGGRVHTAAGRVRSAEPGRGVTIRLPGPLPLGYHVARLTLRAPDGTVRSAQQRLIVTPGRCATARERLGPGGAFGLLANLYTVRSARNWGVGDLTDLRTLVAYAGDVGAAFVGINPLHALHNRGAEISPYSPVSRLYRNPLYLDVGAVPELAGAPRLAARLSSASFRAELEALRAAPLIDYERVMDVKRPVLEALHGIFALRHRGRDTARGRAYRAYLEKEGEPLLDFATFLVLQRHLMRGRSGGYWRRWPARYRHPRSAAVLDFRARHREEVDLHCWLQFEIDRQLSRLAADARARRLPIGIYQDLAIGSSDGGSDAWGFPGLFLERASVGAPPDDYSPDGQNWGLPPVDPRRLAAGGYEYWIRLVRAGLAHAGALRIDHVMGLFRQFWIPAGRSGREGAYVRFPSADLLGILALESVRAGALVIGEDLGTVPRGLPRVLERWGILSNRVLYFARDRRGAFWPASRYPANALLSANTHDMVPLAGFWRGDDLEIRRQVGLLGTPAALAAARRDRERDRRALLRRLRAEGLAPKAGREASGAEICRAVYAFLCRAPAALVGVSLDDLTGETSPVNQPGVGADLYPSWSRRMTTCLEELPADGDVERALAGVRERRGAPNGRAPRRGTRAAAAGEGA
jgi:4-alpha-glucanotransferase